MDKPMFFSRSGLCSNPIAQAAGSILSSYALFETCRSGVAGMQFFSEGCRYFAA